MNILYSTDGKGNWWKREWVEQCSEDVFIRRGQCQGVKGHEGVHWRFGSAGWFEWDEPEGCSGTTPPDHKSYVSPLEMEKKHWLSNYSDTEITDTEKITQLERGECEEEASIDRPVNMDDLEPELRDELEKRMARCDELEKGKM